MNRKVLGHLICMGNTLVWGSAFICTRILLEDFSNAQVMLMRFALAWSVSLLIDHRFPKTTLREEARFAFLAFVGVVLYHALENAALQRTSAANAAILIALAPMFTMLLTCFLLREWRLTRRTAGGLALSAAGVVMVVSNGMVEMRISLLGDLLALGAALCWGAYAVIVCALQKEYPSTLIGRKSLFWSLLFVTPAALLERRPFPAAALLAPRTLAAFIFCGALASGVCNVLANVSIEAIGPVKAANYDYLLPFVGMVGSWLLLGERISSMGAAGAALTVLGVLVSSRQTAEDEKT